MSTIQMVSVLFTDLVGSTALSTQVGPTAAERLRQEHFGLLRGPIDDAAGREVKNLGDGLMVVFDSAAAAVDCAVSMQQRLEQRNRGSDQLLSVRMGVAAGDADREGDDYFGRPVVEAARLCAHAQGGQILCGELVRVMAAGRGKHPFDPVGSLELKGLLEPVDAYAVGWDSGGLGAGLPLPPLLRGVPPVGYVGREQERALLGSLFEQAVAGGCRLALISGEPGIGKTRLATYAALDAHGRGATVLYGRCDEGIAAPYGPWVEALRHWVLSGDGDALREHVARHGGELCRLLPELGRRAPDLPPPTRTDAESERYLLMGAVAGVLEQLSEDQPLVVVLDDLHWADKGSLVLLRHLVGQRALSRVLIVGTYRASDITRQHPLAGVLADLRRIEGVERIDLSGLGEADVIELMRAAAGHELDDDGVALAGEIVRETDGNPFFVAELLRYLWESGALAVGDDGRWHLVGLMEELGLPESVREVVGRRVDRLDPEAGRVLTAAAVIGREFELELLARVLDRSEEDLLDLLEAAVEASLIAEAADHAGRFSFTHALVGHALYDELGATRRARLHRRVAEALEDLYGDDPGVRLGELAWHWAWATEAADPGKAIDYARRAGERALSTLAPDEAAHWFAHALELLDAGDRADDVLRCQVLIGLGDAQRQVGNAEYRATLLDASRLALRHQDGERLAHAVLANSRGRTSFYGEVDEERVELIEAALRHSPPGDGPTRARLLSLLAVELVWGDYARRRAAADEAVEIARKNGDEVALAQVLRDRQYVIWAPGTLAERQANLEELLAIGERLDDPVLRFWTLVNAVDAHAPAGQIAEAHRASEGATSAAEELRQPTLQWVAGYQRACLAMLTGSPSELETLAERTLSIGTASGEPDALMIGGAQLTAAQWGQARWDELLPVVEASAAAFPRIRAFHAGLGAAALEAGRTAVARGVLDEAKSSGLDSIPYDAVTVTTLALYSLLAGGLRDAAAAGVLYEQLAKSTAAVAWNGATTYGAVDVYRGLVAATLGRDDEGEARLTAGIELNDRMGASVWATRGRLCLAELLAARGVPADAQRAEQLFRSVRATAELQGTPGLLERAEAGLSSLAAQARG